MGLTLDKINEKIPSRLVDHGIRAVCFDLDGVLVDAPDWHREAFNLALRDICSPVLSDEDHEANFNGLSTYKKLDILARRGNEDFKFPDIRKYFYDKKQEFTRKLIGERCEPVTRVIDVVNYANSIFDNKTAVVTNCSRSTAEAMLEKSNLLHRFQFIITNEDVDGKIKPHPWPYLLAKNRLGFGNSNKSVLAIDDIDKGIISAVDAQMRTWRLKKFEDLTVRNLMKVLSGYRIRI